MEQRLRIELQLEEIALDELVAKTLAIMSSIQSVFEQDAAQRSDQRPDACRDERYPVTHRHRVPPPLPRLVP
jgi:hypothetical protein